MFNFRDDQEEKYLFIKFSSFSAFKQVNASIVYVKIINNFYSNWRNYWVLI